MPLKNLFSCPFQLTRLYGFAPTTLQLPEYKKKPLSVLSLKGYKIKKTGEERILQAAGFLGLSHVICLGFICCFLLCLHCGLEPLLSPKEQDLPSSIGCQMIWILKVTFEWIFAGSLGESHPTRLTSCFNCFWCWFDTIHDKSCLT